MPRTRGKGVDVSRRRRVWSGTWRIATAVAVAAGCFAAVAVGQTALPIVVTDTSWKVTTSPGSGWNTNAGFNDSGWAAASANGTNTLAGQNISTIWDNTDPQAGSANVYFRKTFNLSEVPPQPAWMYSAVDDDADIWVNGTQVVNNHDCTASELPTVDVRPYLVQGTNLIAVHGIDCGGYQAFELVLYDPQPIPALDVRGLLALAGLLAVVGVLVIRRSAA